MPEDIGYPGTVEGAAEALMKLGKVDPMEFLSKLEAMGFKLEKFGAPMMEDTGENGEMSEEAPPEEMSPDDDEDASPSYPDKYPHEEPGGVNLVIMRQRAAKNAMNPHKKGNPHDY